MNVNAIVVMGLARALPAKHASKHERGALGRMGIFAHRLVPAACANTSVKRSALVVLLVYVSFRVRVFVMLCACCGCRHSCVAILVQGIVARVLLLCAIRILGFVCFSLDSASPFGGRKCAFETQCQQGTGCAMGCSRCQACAAVPVFAPLWVMLMVGLLIVARLWVYPPVVACVCL